MSNKPDHAYTTKQWFWAVNLIAVFGILGVLLPSFLASPRQAFDIFPFALVVGALIAWILIAPPLAYAMRKPATYLRAARWGAGAAVGIAFIGFLLARVMANGQLGGGEYMQMQNGELTPYGWQKVIESNALFVALGLCVSFLVRAVIGPGRTST